MGVVWAAQRADGQFERRVAIKFLSGLLPSALLKTRFLRERGILARLDHPNIARLLDAGVAGDREPYLVMEWVEGESIDKYVRDHSLDVTGILRLFRQVSAAVEHAHRRLVVHRDLKPSNILVADGQCKLLDFGIAKMLDPAPVADASTLLMGRILTPEYSSPEQLRGDEVTTATDVYSLGVVLYELLAGKRPFDFGGKTLKQIVEQAGSIRPARPSAVAVNLFSELDAIVLKAIAPDPAERYGSVAEMSADVDNFLAGRPVRARPSSALYVARKFARRNWLPVSAVALALGVILGSAIVANRQRLKAEQRFAQLRQLSSAVIFEYQDGISALAGTLDVRRKMVKHSLGYLDSLAADAQDDPALLSEVARGYATLAKVQGYPGEANLGEFSGALASIQRAQSLFEKLVALHPDDFEAACDLGDALLSKGVIQKSVPNQDPDATYRQVVAYWEHLAAKYPDRQRALNGLAASLFFKPDIERALVLNEQLAKRFPGESRYPRDIALLCRYIASKPAVTADLPRMRQLLDRAVEIDRSLAKAKPLDRRARLDLSFDLSDLGTWYEKSGDLRGALRMFEEVTAIRDDLVRQDGHDEQAKDRLFYALCQLGRLHGMLREYRESGRDYRSALTLGEELSRTHSQPHITQMLETARTGLARAIGQR